MRVLLAGAVLVLCGCQADAYLHAEPFAGIERKTLTPEALVSELGPPGKVLHANAPHKEGPQADTAYRYYFATRDGRPGAKTFYFEQGRWTGENVLGGVRKTDLFRLLDLTKPGDEKLATEWENAHPNTW